MKSYITDFRNFYIEYRFWCTRHFETQFVQNSTLDVLNKTYPIKTDLLNSGTTKPGLRVKKMCEVSDDRVVPLSCFYPEKRTDQTLWVPDTGRAQAEFSVVVPSLIPDFVLVPRLATVACVCLWWTRTRA